MAKEDFCFTYYDGDAARDKAHMNRLERGGYDDIITSQRKFGHLHLSLIKKTLGSDFDTVWEAIELVLRQDQDGKYFIEWLDISLEKMRLQSSKQSLNGKKGGRPKTQTKPKQNPNSGKNKSQEKPLEDGNEYEEYFEEKESAERKGGFEKDPGKFYPDKSLMDVELDANDFELTVVYLESTTKEKVDRTEIDRQWKGFKIQYFNGRQAYEDWSEIKQHFRDWLKRSIQKNGNKSLTNENNKSSHGKSSGAIKLAHGLAKNLNIADPG